MATTTPDRVEVRLISNALCGETLLEIERLQGEGRVARHYRHRENRHKYPAMREAFRDPAAPIATPYLLWMDDDTICDRNPGWLRALAGRIVAEHPQGGRLYGPHYLWTLRPHQAAWLRAAPWYRGRPFRNRRGTGDPPGNLVHFATGSFWALATELVEGADIPDARLDHNGGDWTIGEQVYQAGYRLVAFSNAKDQVNWSAYERRGTSQAPLTPRAG